jgi:hypothetical protein
MCSRPLPCPMRSRVLALPALELFRVPRPRMSRIRDRLRDSLLAMLLVSAPRMTAATLDAEPHSPIAVAVDADVVGRVLMPLRAESLGAVVPLPTPLPLAVGAIVGVVAEEQVCRVDARRIVAGVAHKHSVGDRAVVKLPRHAVCRNDSPVDTEMTVAPLVVRGSGPGPAPVRLTDLGEESLPDSPVHSVNLTSRAGAVNDAALAGTP